MRNPQQTMGARFNIQYGRAFGMQRAVDQSSITNQGPFPGRTPIARARYGQTVRPSGAIPPLNFNTGGAFDAGWLYREGPVNNACVTQPASFLRRARAAVGLGSGVWDAPFQQALIAQVSALPDQASWASVLNALNGDLAVNRASRTGHQVAIWLTHYKPFNRRLDAISIPSNAQLLVWGESPLPPTDGLEHGLLCFDYDSESIPLTAADQAAAIAESATGIRTGAGRAVPPTGGAAAPPLSEGTTGWRLAAVGVSIAALLWLATSD